MAYVKKKHSKVQVPKVMILEIKNLLGGFLSIWNSNLHVLPEQRVIIEGMFLNYQIFKNTILWITNLLRFRFYNKSMDS